MLTLSQLNLGILETLEKYVFSRLTIFFFLVILSLLVVYVGKLLLENPYKPEDIQFSNFVCMAFWLKLFRTEPHESKSDHFSLLPATHLQWQYVLAGTDVEPCGISGGISGVSLRRAGLVTMVSPSLAYALRDLQPSEFYSLPQLPFLVFSLRSAPSPLGKIHKLFQVLFLII